MKKNSRLIYWVSLVVIVSVGLIAWAFFSAGHWLRNEDKPEKADAIIILSGSPARAFYAADLYNKGYAPYVYISKPVQEGNIRLLESVGIFYPSQDEVYEKVLLKKGVPKGKIRIFEKSIISTIEEAEVVSRLFKGQNCRVLVVTSPFHIRRTKMILRDTVKHCDSRVLGTPYEDFSEKWWAHQDSARSVVLEITKILFYRAGGRFRAYQ